MAAALPLVGLALTAGAGAMQYASAVQANKAYQKNQDEWYAYQKKQSQLQSQKDEANRKKASAAQQQGLTKLGNMPQDVSAEDARLAADLSSTNTLPTAPEATLNNELLSGQGADPGFKEYLAKTIHAASQSARNKAAALATMQAYTGSQFGLGNTNAETLRQAGQGIDLFNNFRGGDLATYRLAQAVPVKQVNMGAGPGIGPALAQIGGSLAGGGFQPGSMASIF
jgi:hypothetical protein